MQHEETLKKVRNVTLVTALVCLAFGITLIGFEAPFRAVIGYVMAIAALALGVVRLIRYLRHRKEQLLATDLFAFCVFLTLGLLCAVFHDRVMDYVMIIIGALLFAGGLIKIQNAIDMKFFGYLEWWISLIPGLVSILFAIVVIWKPSVPLIEVNSLLAGVFLIYDGAASLAGLILAHRVFARIRKGQSPNPERKRSEPEAMENQPMTETRTDDAAASAVTGEASAATSAAENGPAPEPDAPASPAGSFDGMQAATDPAAKQPDPADMASGETAAQTADAPAEAEGAVPDAECEPVPSDPFDARDSGRGDAVETENIGRDVDDET